MLFQQEYVRNTTSGLYACAAFTGKDVYVCKGKHRTGKLLELQSLLQ